MRRPAPTRRARQRLLVAVAGCLLVTLGGCAGPVTADGLRGARLEVLAVWSGTEQQRFEPVLRAFEASTGATITYSPAGHDVADAIDARLRAGRPPDIAFLPQPGLLRQYAAEGRLVPLGRPAAAAVTANYPPRWRDLASVDGRLYGVWFKAAHKSLIWYNVAAFERIGVVPPTDVTGLLATAGKLASSGTPAFAVAGRDSWTLTDLFENLYLTLAGPDRYDALAVHRLPWTDPSVTATLRILARFLAPRLVAGGVRAALGEDFEGSVQQAFTSPPHAAMVCEGDFVAGIVTGRTSARLGVDADVFAFPSSPSAAPAIVAGGDVAVQMRPSPAGAAFLRWLATPEAAAIWARQGGYISPNANLDLSVYPDETSRAVARSLLDGGAAVRFDLSDLQPPAFGSDNRSGMRRELRDFFAHPDVEGTAARLEAAAQAAFTGAPG